MTPKEKAEEIWMILFDKQIEITGIGNGNLCIELALILVDEMLKVISTGSYNETFYKEVKKEMEKISIEYHQQNQIYMHRIP
jgi:oligoribonuclease (3'-5' exoribonuclease)